MKKQSQLLLGFLVLALSISAMSCGGGQKPTDESNTTITEKPAEPKPPTETKPEEPDTRRVIQESQFQTVYFDFDKFNLRSDARSSLDANAQLLKEFPDVVIAIEGHCDERGTVEYNLLLGEKRARSAMDYLTAQGIAASRMSVKSWGKERPAVMGSNEDAWGRNRRAEFKIVSQ